MTATIDPTSAPPTLTPPPSATRPRWPLFGVVAGAAALAAAFTGMPSDLTDEQWTMGVDVIDELDRANYHVAFVLGLVAVAALLVTAAAWRRWADRNAPDDLAARTIPGALAATAALNVLGYSLMGSMALYLPGGMDENLLSREAIFVNFTMLDFGVLLGWWSTVVAAGCVAVLSFRRERILPRWMGVVSVLLMLVPIVFAVLTALPGMPGFTMPLWLVVISAGMVLSPTAARR